MKKVSPKTTVKVRAKNVTLWEFLNQPNSISKITAAVLFIILPFIGFYLGVMYQQVCIGVWAY